MIIDTNDLIDSTENGKILDGGISIISLIEMIRGIESKERKQVKYFLESSYKVYPLENDVILTYAELYNDLKKDGNLIPEADLLIGATAIARDLPLMTKDAHFSRLEKYGLTIA